MMKIFIFLGQSNSFGTRLAQGGNTLTQELSGSQAAAMGLVSQLINLTAGQKKGNLDHFGRGEFVPAQRRGSSVKSAVGQLLHDSDPFCGT